MPKEVGEIRKDEQRRLLEEGNYQAGDKEIRSA